MENKLKTQLLHNPLIDYVVMSEVKDFKDINYLEKEYVLDRKPNALNRFDNNSGDSNLFKYIDQNKLLDLYPEYEKVYGPYMDSCKDHVEYILILFRKEDREVKLKTIYFKRAIEEIKVGYKLSDNLDVNKYPRLDEMLFKALVVNPNSIRVQYTEYILSEDEKKKIFDLYPEYNKINRVSFFQNKNRIVVELAGIYGTLTVNLARLLYEIHIAKRRLSNVETVEHINGKNSDVRLENLRLFNKAEYNNDVKKMAMEKYGLDVDKLLEIYKPTGFNRFRNVYQYKSNGRYYIKLIKEGLNKEHMILLSRALMEVKEGRILDDKLETVDHIDRNNQNDNMSNLRMLPLGEHVSEDHLYVESTPVKCPVCGNMFEHNANHRLNIKKNQAGIFCSTSCGIKARKLFIEGSLIPLKYEDLHYRYYLIDKTDPERKRRIYLENKDYKLARKEAALRNKAVPINN